MFGLWRTLEPIFSLSLHGPAILIRDIKRRPEPVFKIMRWKIQVVPTESTFLRVNSSCWLFLWIQCSIHEKGTDFLKRVDSLWKKLLQKEEVRPYSFSQLVYKFLISHKRLYEENWEPQFSLPPTPQKRESTRCICPHSSKTVFINRVKKSRFIESTLSRISLFWIQTLFYRVCFDYLGWSLSILDIFINSVGIFADKVGPLTNFHQIKSISSFGLLKNNLNLILLSLSLSLSGMSSLKK